VEAKGAGRGRPLIQKSVEIFPAALKIKSTGARNFSDALRIKSLVRKDFAQLIMNG
jgi:hypothetical protein